MSGITSQTRSDLKRRRQTLLAKARHAIKVYRLGKGAPRTFSRTAHPPKLPEGLPDILIVSMLDATYRRRIIDYSAATVHGNQIAMAIEAKIRADIGSIIGQTARSFAVKHRSQGKKNIFEKRRLPELLEESRQIISHIYQNTVGIKIMKHLGLAYSNKEISPDEIHYDCFYLACEEVEHEWLKTIEMPKSEIEQDRSAPIERSAFETDR